MKTRTNQPIDIFTNLATTGEYASDYSAFVLQDRLENGTYVFYGSGHMAIFSVKGDNSTSFSVNEPSDSAYCRLLYSYLNNTPRIDLYGSEEPDWDGNGCWIYKISNDTPNL